MGCIQSNTRHSGSAVVYSPPSSPSRHNSEDDEQVPTDAQNVAYPIYAQPAQMQELTEISSLLRDANELCRQIGEERPNLGESLRPVHENALRLRNDLRLRSQYVEGNAPSYYENRMNTIRQDFHAIISVDAYPERYFHTPSFQIHSPSARSDSSD